MSEEPADHSELTAAVVASFDGCPDPRLRELLQGLVRHLHALAVEMRLTEDEWQRAIDFLSQAGRMTGGRRNELILLSDVLGLSSLVDSIAEERPAGATEATVLGPFWAAGSKLRAYGESIAEKPAGDPAWVQGRVLDLAGAPIAGAEIDVWQNGADRLYAVQDPDAPEHHLRGRFRSREDGGFAFLGVRPVDYTIPEDGPVGRMLAATRRHPWRPAHLHLIASAPGYRTVTTHVFDSESPYLDSDAVFAVKPSLVRTFIRRDAADPDRPEGVDGEWYSVEVDLVLAPE